MKLVDYGRALVRGWWIVFLCLLLGIGGGLAATALVQPLYQSTVTFYVMAPATERQSALQSDELVRGRITAYAALITSEQFVDRVVSASSIELSPQVVRESISAFGDPETLTLTVNVRDPERETTDEIATQIAGTFGKMVNDLESGTAAETVLNVVSGPSTSDNPVQPRPKINLALGILLGLAAGVLIVAARARADKRIRNAELLEEETDLPLLAALPENTTPGPLGSTAPGRRDGSYEEALRGLRTSVQFHPGTQTLQVIAVAPAVHGPEINTVPLNLGMIFAENSGRVLLVEVDARGSGLPQELRLRKSPGLTEVLAGMPAAEAVQTIGELNVLTAGTGNATSPELFSAERMRVLLAELRDEYDLIVLGTAPLVSASDALLACAAADGVLVIADYGRTTMTDIKAALRVLGTVHCTVLGTVLNRVPQRSRRRGRGAGTSAASAGATRPARIPRQEHPADVAS